MRKILLTLAGVATVLAVAPAEAKHKHSGTFVCTSWKNGMCVGTHRVRGTPAAYKVGYVFGPDYSYTTVSNIPQPVTTYYHLDSNGRYVYTNGYVYVVDPTTYAVTKVIDLMQH